MRFLRRSRPGTRDGTASTLTDRGGPRHDENYSAPPVGGPCPRLGAGPFGGQAAWERAGRRSTPAVCGRVWDYWLSTGVYEADEVELHLYRGHAHGSRAGFRELLRTLRVTADDDTVMEESLKSHRLPFQAAGIFTLIMGVLTLGAARIRAAPCQV